MTIPEAVEALGYCERTIYRWENGDGAPRKAALEFLRQLSPASRKHPENSRSSICLRVSGA